MKMELIIFLFNCNFQETLNGDENAGRQRNHEACQIDVSEHDSDSDVLFLNSTIILLLHVSNQTRFSLTLLIYF